MPYVSQRDILPFPEGSNTSETLVAGSPLNLIALTSWNYTLFSNNTISNGSSCFLAFDDLPFTVLPNGTFVNGTSCYFPYNGLGQRGSVGIAFGCLFGISIVLTLVCLKKHGSVHYAQNKSFRAVGRRWQWYWMLWTGACGIISSFSAIDVDRSYLQSSGILIQTFFWYLMLPGVLATVWEGVRHWGSWQERQLYNRDPFADPERKPRSTLELYLPFSFYLFAWLNVFMTLPRNWTGLESQNDPWQVSNIAGPSMTDVRFKLGAVLAFLAWLMVPISLCLSIMRFRSRLSSGSSGLVLWFLPHTPLPFPFTITIPLALIVVSYAAAQSWLWIVSIGRHDAPEALVYGLGYAPIIVILFLNAAAALCLPNEDLELASLRNARDRSLEIELGFSPAPKKPRWMRRVPNDEAASRVRAAESQSSMSGRKDCQNTKRPIKMGLLAENGQEWHNKTDHDSPGNGLAKHFQAKYINSIQLQDEACQKGRRDGAEVDAELSQLRRKDRQQVAKIQANPIIDEIPISQPRSRQVRSMLDI